MAGNVKLMTSAGGGVVLDTATTTATDVTVKVPVTGVNNGTLACTDANGNLGLGVTPSAWTLGKAIQIGQSASFNGQNGVNAAYMNSNAYYGSGAWTYINSDYATSYRQYNGTHVWQVAPSGTAGNAISFTQAMTLDASGNLGIGTSSPAARLDVAGGNARIASNKRLYFGDMATGGFIDDNFGNNDLLNFACKPSGTRFIKSDLSAEFMRIDSGGNVQVGTTTNQTSSRITATATSGAINGVGVYCTTTAITGAMPFFNPNGQVGTISVAGTSTTYATSSDYRLKENIQPMQNALATVAQLNPVTYTWKADGSDGQGFIAHELQAVVPDCVTGEKDATRIENVEISPAVPATFDEEGNELTPAVEAVYEEREVPVYQGIDTSFLVATLTKAIQELSAKNDALEARIAALEAK